MRQQIFITAWVCIIYFLLGILGGIMAIPPGIASPIWPASGFALAVALTLGKKAWPGIFLGAFLTNIWPAVTADDVASLLLPRFWASIGIGAGTLLQAVFGVWLINRSIGNDILKSVNTFLLFSLSIPVICLASSFVGATTIYLLGFITANDLFNTWTTWLIGDAVGILLITPLILAWARREPSPTFTLPIMALYLALTGSTLFSFGVFFADNHSSFALVFLSWPVLLAFALKHEYIHTAVAILIVSAIAVAVTKQISGPFYIDRLNFSLIYLQTFIIATAMTAMTVAALSIGQRRTERKLKAENKERLETELALLKLKESLEEQVKERTKELKEEMFLSREKDRQLLQQSRLAQMGEMISMIAHQWRQPLSSISAITGTLSFDVMTDGYKKEFFAERLDAITELSQHLSSTIDDFKNFYKPDKEPVSTTLETVVTKALNIIKGSLQSHHIEISCEYGPPQEIKLFDNELVQVLLNILKNAQDSLKEKKIENPRIDITVKENSICICDNGGGIPEEILEKIFDPYFSTKDEKNGTGLGLYMSKTIIENHHNGKLYAQNLGEGACFVIELHEAVSKNA